MSRLVHIALKCGTKETLENAAKFYEEIFGIYSTYSKHARGHLSYHMTDGNIDLALMLYDSEDEKEAKLSGAGPCIHHIGIEVEDRPSMIAKIEANGGTIYSDKKEGALKYFSPDGTLGEIVAVGRYQKKHMSEQSRISNVILKVNDIDVSTRFYKNVFDFEEVSRSDDGGKRTVVFSDGESTVTLVQDTTKDDPRIVCWGMEVPDAKAVTEKVKSFGAEILDSKSAGAVVFRGPDGNKAEFSPAA